jgi:uncharacterized membrane protein
MLAAKCNFMSSLQKKIYEESITLFELVKEVQKSGCERPI